MANQGLLFSSLMMAALLPAAARADVIAPGAGGGTGGSPWSVRCAARLELARDDLATLFPQLKEGEVQSVAREQGTPGDPTSSSTIDVVELQLDRSWHLLVRIAADGAGIHRSWSPWQSHAAASGDSLSGFLHRTSPTAQAWIELRRPSAAVENVRMLEAFARTFSRAADDCLAMRRLP
jgi:hypothetical protein